MHKQVSELLLKHRMQSVLPRSMFPRDIFPRDMILLMMEVQREGKTLDPPAEWGFGDCHPCGSFYGPLILPTNLSHEVSSGISCVRSRIHKDCTRLSMTWFAGPENGSRALRSKELADFEYATFEIVKSVMKEQCLFQDPDARNARKSFLVSRNRGGNADYHELVLVMSRDLVVCRFTRQFGYFKPAGETKYSEDIPRLRDWVLDMDVIEFPADLWHGISKYDLKFRSIAFDLMMLDDSWEIEEEGWEENPRLKDFSLAVMMGFHSRLGSECPFRALDADLVRRFVLPHAMPTFSTRDLLLLLDKCYNADEYSDDE